MRVLPFLAALVIQAQIIGAVVLAVHGAWLLTALLVVGAIALDVVALQVRRKAEQPQPSEGYTETTYVGW